MVIGVLALQGAVSEHCRALGSLQVRSKEVRRKRLELRSKRLEGRSQKSGVMSENKEVRSKT